MESQSTSDILDDIMANKGILNSQDVEAFFFITMDDLVDRRPDTGFALNVKALYSLLAVMKQMHGEIEELKKKVQEYDRRGS